MTCLGSPLGCHLNIWIDLDNVGRSAMTKAVIFGQFDHVYGVYL